MPNPPMISAREWKLLEPHLPATGGPGKPRQNDRAFVSALCYAEACRCSLQSLPSGYPNPRSLQTRRQRWRQDGTWDRIMAAAAVPIARMRDEYWGHIRGASDTNSPDWKTSSEFFGHGTIPRLAHAQPKGRYADRRRRA